MEKISIAKTLRELEVGQVAEFPASVCASVRGSVSTYGFQLNKTFKTKIDRENRVIRVTRLS